MSTMHLMDFDLNLLKSLDALLDTGNVTYNLLKMTGSNGVAMGPVLLGAARPVHILTTSATVRRVINMTALAVVNAQLESEKR
jgi:malate dehydrogenase (oxaloacetate-decarboxylating)(NADP+)